MRSSCELRTDWPECRNCEEPAAAYLNDATKPRLYCSDECMVEYNSIYSTYGGKKEVKNLAPHWPMCIGCGLYPRALYHPKMALESETLRQVRLAKREARELGFTLEPPTLLFKFCSIQCREEAVAPYREAINRLFDVDDLEQFDS